MEIGSLGAEKIIFFKFLSRHTFFDGNYIGINYKNAFRINFGLWEVPETNDNDDDDDEANDDDDDDDDYDVFSSSQMISNTIGTREGGQ